MVLDLFHNGKICNGPSSVSQWENLQWSQLCFTMGKFAMILALFHNGKIYNAPPGSVSQWESLQWSQLCFTMAKFTMLLLALFHNEKIIRIKH
jgi:hypothetical protein